MADGQHHASITMPTAFCAVHGAQLKRAACAECNSAYMRDYLRNRRQFHPEIEILQRARKRASKLGAEFSLTPADITIPVACPALGIPLKIGSTRSGASPSLDRIDPHKGYISGNVRVISDRANQLKGAGDLRSLTRLATTGRQCLREEYAAIVRYLERESLLAEVRRRALLAGRHGEEWAKVALFLDRAFRGRSISPLQPDY